MSKKEKEEAKKMTAAWSGTNFGFSAFNDEETKPNSTRSNIEESKEGTTSSFGKIFGRGRSITPVDPPKKSFGAKVKGLFGIGKKSDKSTG